jgi:uncharacterized protein (TIGR03437 family)
VQALFARILILCFTCAAAQAFQAPTTSLLVQSTPPGMKFTLDGGPLQQAPIRLDVTRGTHTISVASPQFVNPGWQYVFLAWSDGGAATHTFTVGTQSLALMANFKAQYRLTLTASPAGSGSLTPASGIFYDAGTVVPITATPAAGNIFLRWNGAVANGNSASTTATMSEARDVIALFAVAPTTLVVSPARLTFSYRLGDAGPPAQAISVFSGGAFTAKTDQGFILLRPPSGNAPGVVTVLISTTGLTAGTFTANVTITQSAAPGSSYTVQVTLTVEQPPPPRLSLSPDRFSLNFVQGSPATHLQLVVLNAGGGAINFSAQLNVQYGGPWATLDNTTGTATSAAPGSIGISLNVGQLNAGVYQADVVVQDQASGQSQTSNVIVSVTGRALSIQLSQSGLQFSAIAGGAASPPQTFSVANAGQGSLNWTTSVQIFGQVGGWLSATPGSGVSTGGGASPAVTVSVDASHLTAGVYAGLVHIVSPGAANSPQAVTVVLNVTEAAQAPPPMLSDAGALLVGDPTVPRPPPSQIAISNLTGQPLTFVSTAATEDGTNWLSLSPATGTLTTDKLTTIGVQPNFASLAPGVRRGTLNISFSDGSVRTISVASVVPETSGTATGKNSPRAALACSPRGLVPAFLSLEPNFAVTTNAPVSLRVAVVDTCGTPLTAGGVFVRFSNNPSSIALVHTGNGNWTGTWVPGSPNASVGVIATAFSVGNTPLGGQTPILQGAIRTTAAALPRADHIVDAASLKAGDQVAIGSWATLFGDAFADGEAQATSAPYGSPLGVTEVRLGDVPLPLLYVNANQVNALIPRNLDPNTQHQIVVQRGPAISVPVQITVADVLPGIYTVSQDGLGQGAILIGDTGLLAAPAAGNARPVKRGESVTIFLSGLGPVEAPPPDGTPAPDDQPSRTLATPLVTMGDAQAEVQFSGLAQGQAGTYKIVAVVPDDAPSGDTVTLVVTMNGVPSNPVTIAIE